MGLELDKAFNTHRDKTREDEGACAWHMLITSQRMKEGGMGIYKRRFPGIMREVQLGITLPSTAILLMQQKSKLSLHSMLKNQITKRKRNLLYSPWMELSLHRFHVLIYSGQAAINNNLVDKTNSQAVITFNFFYNISKVKKEKIFFDYILLWIEMSLHYFNVLKYSWQTAVNNNLVDATNS